MNKAYKIKLYPNEFQKNVIDQTVGNCRFIFNALSCERIKIYEKLKERIYFCSCGNIIDRDFNAGLNLRNLKSEEYFDYRHGEKLNPVRLSFNFAGFFDEVFTEKMEKCA